MLKKKKEQSFNLSYESDGKMGDKLKEGKKKKENNEFFNTTQQSE